MTLVAMLLTGLGATAQGYLHAAGERIVDGAGKPVLLRGMGLGGWMLQEPYMLGLSGVAVNQQEIRARITEAVGEKRSAAFYAAWLQHFATKADIDSMAAWGFNSVRLPMHYALYTLPVEAEPVAGKQTWLPEGFRLTDSLLRWCAANKMYLILDLHAAPGGQGNDLPIADRDSTKPSLWQSAAAREKTVALWKELARRYAGEPWIGGYDLLNETNWNFSDPSDKHGCNDSLNVPMRALYERITTAIRSVDRNHLLIIEGNCWGNNYRNVLPPWDKNMALSFHRYWNENSEASLQSILSLRRQYHMPVWMGESGENSNAWFRDAVRLLEGQEIGWAWWPLKKMGMNNPLEIPSNPNFKNLQEYWKGKAPKPQPDSAFAGLMQLARDSRTDHARFHPDVVDALFRQVRDGAARPYRQYRVGRDTVLPAVHFDMGPIGAAYQSNTPGNYWVSTGKRTDWNRGWTYRNDAIDILALANGYEVELEPGEWVQYTFSADGGAARFILTANSSTTAKPQLWLNGKALEPVAAKETWVLTNLPLLPGTNRLRVGTEGGTLRFSSIGLVPTGAAGQPKN
ncbi:glycosyl hydrolase family 5 [Flaviaesturariibacter flavus]|uniref:Glycosyl hydrolase family 5 n=1 Tax=Flaviaesturariibacter flavus TaxID=2502780 RepID=A0A4V2NVP1_9BACT|nr:cellulase family glycosylhydrolase [Flaviaesturariibacter flavus]TCJ14242.1 glycosyl hydrolase family 5 [Flaviaesturariibacter flavus]